MPGQGRACSLTPGCECGSRVDLHSLVLSKPSLLGQMKPSLADTRLRYRTSRGLLRPEWGEEASLSRRQKWHIPEHQEGSRPTGDHTPPPCEASSASALPRLTPNAFLAVGSDSDFEIHFASQPVPLRIIISFTLLPPVTHVLASSTVGEDRAGTKVGERGVHLGCRI